MTTKKPQTAVGEKPRDKSFGMSASGAMRESIGTKISTHLVPYELTLAAAVGLNYGQEKYDARNFEQGMLATSLLGSIERHNKAIMDGEVYDAPTGLPHYCLLASSVAMLIHNIVNVKIENDLPVPKATVTGGKNIGELAEHFQQLMKDRLYIMTVPTPAVD